MGKKKKGKIFVGLDRMDVNIKTEKYYKKIIIVKRIQKTRKYGI